MKKADVSGAGTKKEVENLKKDLAKKELDLKQQRNVVLQKNEEFAAFKKESERKTEEKKLAGELANALKVIKDLKAEVAELKVKEIEDK